MNGLRKFLLTSAVMLASTAAHANMITHSWNQTGVTVNPGTASPAFNFNIPLGGPQYYIAFPTYAEAHWIKITFSATCNLNGNSPNSYSANVLLYMTLDGKSMQPGTSLLCGLADTGIDGGSNSTGYIQAFALVGPGTHYLRVDGQIALTSQFASTNDVWTISDVRLSVEN